MWDTIRTLGWVIWLMGYMVGRLPLYFKAKRLEKQGRWQEREELIQQQVHIWANKLLRHIKMEVTVQGTQHLPKAGEVVVYASNHQSFLDIPVLLAHLHPPVPLLARSNLGKVPLLGLWMRQLGCVFVQREDARAAMQAMKEAGAVIDRGSSFIIFPEGTRSQSDRVGKFMPGVVRIASKAGVPIVPVAISGSFKGLEGNGNRVKPARVQLTFLPPIQTDGLDKEAQRALAGQLEEQVRTAVEG